MAGICLGLPAHTELENLFGVQFDKLGGGCPGSGVQAVAEKRSAGLVDNWLRHVEDIAHKHSTQLDATENDVDRGARLAELNVIEQVSNVCRTTILRRAWYRGYRIEVHGLIYGLEDGLLRRIGVSVADGQSWREAYAASLKGLPARTSPHG